MQKKDELVSRSELESLKAEVARGKRERLFFGGIILLFVTVLFLSSQDMIFRTKDGSNTSTTRITVTNGSNTATVKFSKSNLQLENAATGATAEMRFLDLSSNYVGFKAPNTVASNTIWTLPSSDGSSGQVLATNGGGTLSWQSLSGVSVTSLNGQNGTITIAGANGNGVSAAGGTVTVTAPSVSGGIGLLSSLSGNTWTVDLQNTSVSAGTYGAANQSPVFTVDAQGRITSASSVPISGVTPAAHTHAMSDITTGTLGFTQGGTGLTSAGASGNYLRSNGTAWASSTIQGGDLPTTGVPYVLKSGDTFGGSLTFNDGSAGATSHSFAVGGDDTLAVNATTVTATGTITAASFSGDGSALTGVTASAMGFDAVTSGTNANALVVGGTLAPTGAGTITANLFSGQLSVANGGTGFGTTPANGQLLIGNGSGYTLANLTAGSGVNITNGAGTITVATVQDVSSTASPTYAGLTISGNSSISGTLSAGATTVSSMTVTGNGTVSGTFTTAGAAALATGGGLTTTGGALVTSGALTVSAGGASITGNSSVTGNVSISGTTAHGNSVQLDPYGVLAGNTSEIRFMELAANGTNYVGFKSPNVLAANVIWTLPNADGVANSILQTNGAGTLSWVSPASLGAVATINTIAPNGSGDFAINAGTGISISPGTNSITIATTQDVSSSASPTYANLTVSGTGSFGATVTIQGSAVVNGNVLLGDAAADQISFNGTAVTGLNMGGNSVTNANAFSGVSLSLTGNATLSGGNFSQTGAVTFSTGTGAISLNGNTSVTGSNTFTVGTGATTVGGTLTVAGTTTHNGTTALNGATTVTANFSQTGANTFSTGTGAVSLNGNTSVTGASTFTVGTGATTLGGSLNVSGATSLGGLSVAATSAFSNTLTVTSVVNAIQLQPAAAATAEIHFLELAANGTNYAAFKAASSMAANVIWTLPAADGSAGFLLKTDGSGNLSWVSPASSGAVTTINSIAPNGSGDFAINAGTGISVTGGANSITVANTGVLSVTAGGVLSSSGGTSPNISLTGIVPVANGGTGLAASGADGNLLISSAGVWTSATMSGDAAISAAGALTLANTGVGAGAYGSASSVATFTVDSKGRLTAAANAAIAIDASAITSGTLGVTRGGTGSTSFTNGSVIFSNGTTLTQDNANLFWDDTNKKLAIGTNSPDVNAKLDIVDSVNTRTWIGINNPNTGNNVTSELRLFSGTPQFDVSLQAFSPAWTSIADLQGYGRLTVNNQGNGIILHTKSTSGGIQFWVGDTDSRAAAEKMRVTSSGNVGIGTETPAQKLDVNGNVNISGNLTVSGTNTATAFSGTLPVGNGGTGTATAFTQGSVVFAGASGVYSQDNSNLFWDDTNNRLGIGTSSPSMLLDVVKTAQAGQEDIAKFGVSDDSSNFLKIINGTAADGEYSPEIDGYSASVKTALHLVGKISSDSGTQPAIQFVAMTNAGGMIGTRPLFQWWEGVGTVHMTMDSAGNLGIGTDTPGQKLSVAGTIESTSGGFKFPDATVQTTAANLWGASTPNTWTQKIANGAGGSPSTRDAHAMVRVGSQIIMFGGIDNTSTYLNDVWAYDIVTNTWAQKIANGAAGSPQIRKGCAMLWDGTRVIMFGGTYDGTNYLNDLWWYDPYANTWTQKIADGDAGSPPRRVFPGAVWDGAKVILFGGENSGFAMINDLWWYNPATNLWASKIANGDPGSPLARRDMGIVWDGTNVILVGGDSGGPQFNDTWWYNPAGNAWTQKIANGDPGSPQGRYGHSVVWDGARAILFGGWNGAATLNDLWWYNPAGNVWAQKIANGAGGSPPIRNAHRMVMGFSFVVMFGGSDGGTYYNDLWRYDPVANTFNPSAENIGIGTSSPSAKLDVVGNANISGSLNVGTDGLTVGGNQLVLSNGSLGIGTDELAGFKARILGDTMIGGEAFALAGVMNSNPSSGDDEIMSIVVDTNSIYAVGYTDSPGNRAWRIEKRFKSSGALDTSFNGTGFIISNPTGVTDVANAVAADASYIYIAGSENGGPDSRWRIEKRDKLTGALVSAFNGDGVVISDPSTITDVAYAIAVDSSFIYVAGNDEVPGAGNRQWRIEKRDKGTGALVAAFDGDGIYVTDPTAIGDYIYSIAVDSSYLYLGGIQNAGGNIAGRIEKLNKTTGALETTFDGDGILVVDPTAGDDEIHALAIDTNFMYIAERDDGGDRKWRIEKRNIATGALITSFGTSGVVLSNPSGGEDISNSIAVDADSIYVAGYESNSAIWRIEKRDIMSGALMTSFGTAGVVSTDISAGQDTPRTVALDGGYLFVGGMDSIPGNAQWRLEKRNATSGALIDSAQGMFVGQSGSIGIGTNTPKAMLDVAGNAIVAGKVTASSFESTSVGYKFPDGTTQTTAAGGAGAGVQSFTASGSFIVPAGITRIYVTMAGGGGGGGGGGGSSAGTGAGGGAGGNGGSVTQKLPLDVTPGETVTVTVGAAGSGGAGGGNGANGSAGTAGGNTSVAGSFGTMTCPGGGPGGGGNTAASGGSTAVGTQGLGIQFTGLGGVAGIGGAPYQGGDGGPGGDSLMGTVGTIGIGGVSPTLPSAAVNSTQYGGGGSGGGGAYGGGGLSGANGGNGAPGVVIIEW